MVNDIELQFDLLGQLNKSDVPYLDQYFGFWAVLEQPFRAAAESVRKLDLVAHIKAADAEQMAADGRSTDYPTSKSGVAIISIDGLMMKHTSSYTGGTSTIRVRRHIRAAARDEDVSGILLRWDSPGGTVSGTADLADEIARAAKQKPVYSFVEDLAASAAVWGAVQADRVYANNETAMFGSIGTYAVVEDLSGMAESLGVVVHVIRAGKFKGAGTPGTKITEEQLAHWQSLVDSSNEQFLAGVARGRNISLARVVELADGRAHPATVAVSMGLLDGIKTFDETLEELEQTITQKWKGNAMSKETTQSVETGPAEPKALTIKELKAMFPKASADFVLGLAERGATKEDAQLARIEALEAEAAAKDKQHSEEIEKAKSQSVSEGVEPLTSSGAGRQASESGDPIAEFGAAVTEKVNRGVGLLQARVIAARENPQLHHQFLMATNPGKMSRRLIEEKYDSVS